MASARVKSASLALKAEPAPEAEAPEAAPAVAAPGPAAVYEDAFSFGQANVEAVFAAGSILSQGLQDIGQAVAALARESLEETAALSQQMLTARSLKDAVDLQASLFRSGFGRLLAEGPRLTDLSVRLAELAFKPINARITASMDVLAKPLV